MNSRRDFLQKLTTSVIAYHFPVACKEFYKQSDDLQVLRVAIMGLGGYGTRVAEAMQFCKKAKLSWGYQWNSFQNKRLAEQVQYPGEQLLQL